MSIQQVQDAPSVSGVQQNGTATIALPVGTHTYDSVGIELSGTYAKTDITDIKARINANTFQEWAQVSHLEAVNAFYLYTAQSDTVILPFRKAHMIDAVQADRFGVGTHGINTFHITHKIGNSATAPIETVYAEKQQLESFTNRNGEEIGVGLANSPSVVDFVKHFTYSLTGSGTTAIDNLPRRYALMALHILQGTPSSITKVEAKVDNQTVWEASYNRMIAINEKDSNRDCQTNWYHIDFMRKDERGGELLLEGTQDFRLIITHSQSCDIDLYTEYMAPALAGF